MSNISVLILAAGKGVRMKSDLPKVLHSVGRIPMIERVVRSTLSLKPDQICVIVGHGGDAVKTHLHKTFPKQKISYVTQKVLNGSGGAVRQSLSWLKKQRGEVLVCCGDAPLIPSETFQTLIKDHRTEKNLATILTAQLPDPSGYGRIVRQADGSVSKIVEHLDASYDQRKILEINSGTYCFHAPSLTRILPKITNNNAKKEYYLTDAIELLRTEGRIGGYLTANSTEVLGVNNRSDMAKAEAHLFKKKNEILMSEGVTIIDPSSCYIKKKVKIEPDTVIWPQTMIFGHTTIGKNCQIGPWTKLNNMTIADEVIVQASFCEDSVVRTGARVGPYS
jgi:bifunctional UDP-N-acetylglucosamine pyrophosphorylase/glucosamine-1-phosphate N-acetyltransferase